MVQRNYSFMNAYLYGARHLPASLNHSEADVNLPHVVKALNGNLLLRSTKRPAHLSVFISIATWTETFIFYCMKMKLLVLDVL